MKHTFWWSSCWSFLWLVMILWSCQFHVIIRLPTSSAAVVIIRSVWTITGGRLVTSDSNTLIIIISVTATDNQSALTWAILRPRPEASSSEL